MSLGKTNISTTAEYETLRAPRALHKENQVAAIDREEVIASDDIQTSSQLDTDPVDSPPHRVHCIASFRFYHETTLKSPVLFPALHYVCPPLLHPLTTMFRYASSKQGENFLSIGTQIGVTWRQVWSVLSVPPIVNLTPFTEVGGPEEVVQKYVTNPHASKSAESNIVNPEVDPEVTKQYLIHLLECRG